MSVPFASETLEDLFLKRVGAHIDERDASLDLLGHGVDSLHEGRALVRDEVRIVPVTLERCPEALDESPCFDCGEAHIPLSPIVERGVGEVRRTDVRGREAGLSLEEPGLGVEPGAALLVRDPDGRTPRDEGIQRLGLGHAAVRGCQDAQRHSARDRRLNRLEEHPYPAPDDEGA